MVMAISKQWLDLRYAQLQWQQSEDIYNICNGSGKLEGGDIVCTPKKTRTLEL